MQPPLMQNYADRTIGDCFSSLGGGDLAEARRACIHYAPKVKNSLPKARTARERGAHESRRLRCLERAPSRELAHAERNSAYADRAAGRRQACSCAKSNVALLAYATLKRERGRANVLELTRARPVRSGGATQRVALTEPRKRRAKRRPRVGCCDELAR
jgi:hypothetical protein